MLLHPINGAMGLFLPFETCENASKLCKLYCYQQTQSYPTKAEKIKTLRLLLNIPPEIIANRLFDELNGEILHWFVSGDCWHSTMTVFWDVIYRLDNMGCKQLGFTRNKKLWENVPDIFILSLDSKDQLSQFENRLCFPDQERIENHNVRVAIPNTFFPKKDTGVKIYELNIVMKNIVSRCTGACGVDYNVEHKKEFGKLSLLPNGLKDCSVCANKNKGCFKRNPFEIAEPYWREGKITLDNLPETIRPYMLGQDLDWF